MESLFKIFLYTHICCGFTALIIGLVPILAKKGSQLHNTTGLIYFWAMFGVFLTSQPMALIKSNPFLFTIGIFSFYFVWTGYRFAKRKNWKQLNRLDKEVMRLTLLTSIAMIFFAIYYASLGVISNAIIIGIFGMVCFIFSFRDLKRLGKVDHPKQWIILHLTRMLGGYIATFTAFAATNLYFLPKLVIWLMPITAGSIGITFAVIYYRRKFKIS